MTKSKNQKIRQYAIMAFVAWIVLLTAVLIDEARADRPDIHYYPDAPGPVAPTFTGMDNTEFDKAQAMSAAGDTCVFDYAEGWQGCVGGGWYGSASALNGSVVTRVDNFAFRFNLQTDTDFDEQAVAIGGSWHF